MAQTIQAVLITIRDSESDKDAGAAKLRELVDEGYTVTSSVQLQNGTLFIFMSNAARLFSEQLERLGEAVAMLSAKMDDSLDVQNQIASSLDGIVGDTFTLVNYATDFGIRVDQI